MDNKEIQNLFKKQPKRSNATDQAIEQVRIHNLVELKNLVKRLKPDQEESVAPIIIDTKKAKIADESYSGMVSIPQSGGQSTLRRTLLDGFEIIKNHKKYRQASLASVEMKEEFGGFQPAVAPDPDGHHTWLDTFIMRNMGGRREGLYIVWDLPEGKFKLDPWTCQLEKVEG